MQSKKSMVSRNFDLILKSQSVYLEVFFIFKSAELFTMKSRADFQTIHFQDCRVDTPAGVQVTWMIEWGQKSKPQKIPWASNKTQ